MTAYSRPILCLEKNRLVRFQLIDDGVHVSDSFVTI